MNVIGMQKQIRKESEDLSFVDPGYNDKKES